MQCPGLLYSNWNCLTQPSEKIILTWVILNSNWKWVAHSFTKLCQEPGRKWKGGPTAMDLHHLLWPIPRSINHICNLLLSFLPEKEITKKFNKYSFPPWIVFEELVHEVEQAITKLLLNFFSYSSLFCIHISHERCFVDGLCDCTTAKMSKKLYKLTCFPTMTRAHANTQTLLYTNHFWKYKWKQQ